MDKEENKKKVMVVDDERHVVDQVSLFLMEHGYKPIPVTNALDAMSLLATEQPDLIILDIKMPRLDGMSFLQSMRQGMSTKDIPVIIASALSETELKLRARKLGVSQYLVKPYQSKQLLEMIQAVFKK